MTPHLSTNSLNPRREVISVALAAAEVSWVAAIFIGLGAGSTAHPAVLTWLGMLIVMLAFFYFYRAVAQASLPLKLHHGLLVLVLLVSIVLVLRFHVYTGPGSGWLASLVDHLSDLRFLLPPELIAAILLVYFWGRAIHLARRSLSTTSVGFTFRAGVVILVWFSLGAALLFRRDVSPFIAPYFFFALLAVALARIEEVSQLPGGSQAKFSGYWVGSSLAAVAVLVLLGMIVAVFFYSGGLEPILRLLTPLYYLVVGLLLAVALLMFAALNFILGRLSINWDSIGRIVEELMGRLSAITGKEGQPPPTPAEPAFLRTVHLGGNLLLIAGLIAVILVITWYRLRHAGVKPENETRESLSSGSLADLLAGLLQAGRQRLTGLGDLAGRLTANRLLSALSIRRIYASLARLAAEAGYPRASAQTPYEYLPTLGRAFPGLEPDLALITEAYVNAHYGRLPDTPEDLQLIRDAWSRVHAGHPGRH